MNLFGKSKKTKKSECRIIEKIEHSDDKYTVAVFGGDHWSYDFSVTEIAHIDDGHNNPYFEGKGKSKDFYLPMNPYGKPDSSMATQDFEFKLYPSENTSKMVEALVNNKYKIDEEKLWIDYNTSTMIVKGTADLYLFDMFNLSLSLTLNDELFQRIYSAIKDGQPLSKIEFQLTFFNLYRSDSDSKDSNIFYLEERSSDTTYQSLGLFNNLTIGSHKTIIP